MSRETLSIEESAINVIASGTKIEGKVEFEQITRVHGVLVGHVSAKAGSTLILAESSVVEGDVDGDVVIVQGFVRGDVSGKTKVVLSGTGRVVGNIKTPSLKMEFGGYFEGRCQMEQHAPA